MLPPTCRSVRDHWRVRKGFENVDNRGNIFCKRHRTTGNTILFSLTVTDVFDSSTHDPTIASYVLLIPRMGDAHYRERQSIDEPHIRPSISRPVKMTVTVLYLISRTGPRIVVLVSQQVLFTYFRPPTMFSKLVGANAGIAGIHAQHTVG